MSRSGSDTTRRAFFVKGAATLGAGLAAATAASAAMPAPATPDASVAAEREAIRSVHQAFIAGVEDGQLCGAEATHHAYRSNARQGADQLVISADGLRAEATWHVDVKLGTPLEGDSTAAQMARLQGMLSDLRWESGILAARYEKRAGTWALSSLRYQAA